MAQDVAFAAQLADTGMTVDAFVEAMQGTLNILLGLVVVFHVAKIWWGCWAYARPRSLLASSWSRVWCSFCWACWG